MLASNAESLYWIGRYVERADDTARILDVAVHQLLDDASVDPDRTSRLLLRVLGIDAARGRARRQVGHRTGGVQRATGGSIIDSLANARENARGAREVTSSEMWECLNTTYNGLPNGSGRRKRLGPHEFFRYVEDRAAMFAGLADSTLSRDDGYRFLLLGRSIERVDMTGADAAVPCGRPPVLAGVGDGAALRGRARHLPAHIPRRARRQPGGRVHPAGPAVSAVGVPRAAGRRSRAWPTSTTGPSSRVGPARRGAAAARQGAQRTRVPAARRAARGSAGSARGAAGDLPRASAKPSRCSISTPRRGWRGPTHGSAAKPSWKWRESCELAV